ncbi:MAG: sensor histidine kinase [Moorea sp. SIO2B7]|nr:sensor histidine kinase [Moorena sp. SIO2B7]
MNDEIEALKEELKQTKLALQMAAQMSQFKGGFLARTSHELRSPLSSLIGLHQLIVSDLCDDPEEEREFVAQAYQYALKLMGLIDEIVAISKIEYGRQQLEIKPIKLAQVLFNVHSLIHLQAANRSLRLEISSPNAEVYIMADEKRFQQMLVTLVDTAISSLEEGTIAISTGVSPKSDLMEIYIDIPCPASIWSEPADLLQKIPEVTLEATPEVVKTFSKTLEFSPGMKLLLAQNLLDVMQGKLEVLDLSTDNGGKNSVTRLQCSISVASAEAVALELNTQ